MNILISAQLSVYCIPIDVVKPNITPETVILHRNVIEGDSIYITCSATGSPPPHIAWRIPQGSKRISLDPVEVISIGVGNITSVTRRLQIYQISRNDSGSYRCSATNYLGNDKHSIVLNVQCVFSITCVITCTILFQIVPC